MNVTVFNPAQLQVLDMMSFVDSPEALAELKKAISDYFAKQAQKEIDRLWENGELNEEKVEKFYQLHERTPINEYEKHCKSNGLLTTNISPLY